MDTRLPALLLALALLLSSVGPGGTISEFSANVIVKAIRENVAGLPVVRNQQNWHFNPDEGLIRRQQFERLHGPRAQWLIRALGEGEGGFAKYSRQEGDS